MTRRQRGTLAAAIVGSAIVFLDGTLVNLALQLMGADLPSTILGRLEGQTYVTSGYLATLAAFLVLAGALGDYYGRRRMFLIGLVGFGATSLLCGLAPNLELLVIGRLAQGLAGALLVPGSLSIITHTFEGPARARAFGLWAAATSAVATLGPPIGGVLAEVAGWRSLFLVNVPLVIAAVWLTARFIDESRAEGASRTFDWLGATVAVLAVGGLAFGATRGYASQWHDEVGIGAIGLGALALIAFPILMTRRAHPLVPLSLFRNRVFSTINLATLLIYGALYTTFGFQALFLQGTLGYSPLGAAIIGLPVGILMSLLSTRIGTLSGRFGVRPFLVAGPLVMALGQLWWLTVQATSTGWNASLASTSSLWPPIDALVGPLPAICIFGVGLAVMVAPLTTGLMTSVPARNAGLASAINNALSRVGQPLVAAAVFIVVSGTFYATLAAAVPGTDPGSADLRRSFVALAPPPKDAPPVLIAAARSASTDAYHLAVMVAAGLLVAGAGVSAIGLRRNEGGTTEAGRNEAGRG